MSHLRDTQSEIAAARAVGRELATAALPRYPVLGLAAGLIGPLVGLFRRRAPGITRAGRGNPRAARRSSAGRNSALQGSYKDVARMSEGSLERPRTAAWPQKGGSRHG